MAADARVTLRIGERVAPQGLGAAVTLTDVRDDSRCPVDVTCVWAGDATVVVDVRPDGGAVTTVTLHLARDDARSATVAGLRLRLDGLDPPARASQPIPRAEYRVALTLSR